VLTSKIAAWSPVSQETLMNRGHDEHTKRGSSDCAGWSKSQQRRVVLALAMTVIFAIASHAITSDAAAFPAKSLYTTIDLKSCQNVKKDADGARWLCKGLPGYPVYVAEGDLRMFVSVGVKPETRRAANQTLRAFNTLFTGKTKRSTIEWRFVKLGSRTVPYATILRYATQNDTAKGQILVVAKVTPTQTCHVAYIDAIANLDAIEIARKIADETARTFDCATDPKIEGLAGKSPL
jgi:hypothetical protein